MNVSHVLAEEEVSLAEVAGGIWAVYCGPLLLGRFDERAGRIHGAHNRNRLQTVTYGPGLSVTDAPDWSPPM